MSNNFKDKFKTLNISVGTYNKLSNFINVNKMTKYKLLNDALNFYIENKLYEEFAKSSANKLLDLKFKINNEFLNQVQIQNKWVFEKIQEEKNELKNLVKKLIEQSKNQQDEINDINKFLVELIENKKQNNGGGDED
ncbi:MAG: hypothetical protein LBH55_00715 [Mycoplasmataceae bacterium]|jgi:hypothetical protein|nr:hypothetical protein [Mycoplasmataceae bacterium]